MKIRLKMTILAGMLFLVLTSCTGLSPLGTLTAPSLTDIRASLVVGNTECMSPVAFSAVTLPPCVAVDVTDVTYTLSGLPASLAFDSVSLSVSMASGYTVLPTLTAPIEVTYTCSGLDSIGQAVSASQVFVINDCDGGGVTDAQEYLHGEVPLLSNIAGYIVLTPENVDIYRSTDAVNGGYKIATSLNIPAGMDPTDPSDDEADFDGDGFTNGTEITDNIDMFSFTSSFPLPDPPSVTFVAADHAGSTPWAVAAADFDNDGITDMVTGENNGDVTFYHGNATSGNFDAGVVSSLAGVAEWASKYTAADFNNDGNMDIAAVAEGATLMFIAVGDGAGNFSILQRIVIGASPFGIAAADFNGDGNIDLATLFNAALWIYINDGNIPPQFNNFVFYLTGFGGNDLTTGDFDNDGIIDIVVVNSGGGTQDVAFYGGLGNGQFAAPVLSPMGKLNYSVVSADFDNDGNLDVAIGTTDANDSLILALGNGNGTFDAPIIYTNIAVDGQIVDVVAADFDGDNFPDLAVPVFTKRHFVIALNTFRIDGTVDFVFSTDTPAGAPWPLGVSAAQFGDSGKISVVLTTTTVGTPVRVYTQP